LNGLSSLFLGGGAALCSPFVGCRDAPPLPFVGAGVRVVGRVHGGRGMVLGRSGRLWGGGACGPCSRFMGWGGPSAPLIGGGGESSSALAGGGDGLLLPLVVPLRGNRRCGWGPCSSLAGCDAGSSLAVVVGPDRRWWWW
jgi:hypothetical protein